MGTVDDGQKLGEWAGLCKIDKEGEARKIVRCSCVVIRDWGKPSQAQEYLEDHQEAEGLTAQGGSRRARVPHVRVKSRPLRLIFFYFTHCWCTACYFHVKLE